jgi:hypothetical protein
MEVPTEGRKSCRVVELVSRLYNEMICADQQQDCFCAPCSSCSVLPLLDGLDDLTPGDRSSSKTPSRTFCRISRAACSKAFSTLRPDFALASIKSKPSSFANASPSSVVTSRRRCFDAAETVLVDSILDLDC